MGTTTLVAAVARAGYVVRAATRGTSAPFAADVERVVVSDFADPVDWDAIMRDADVVVHAATANSATASKPMLPSRRRY